MSIAVTFNGVAYTIPSPGESSQWATSLNLFLKALADARPGTTVNGAAAGATAGVTATSAVSSVPAISGIASAAAGDGVYGEATNNGYGVRGVHTTGTAVIGVATSGSGVVGTSTSGSAVKGVSTLGYGVLAQGDTTTPNTAALRVVPQDTQPAGPNLVGDIYVTTAGLLKICTVAGTPGTWVSVGAQT